MIQFILQGTRHFRIYQVLCSTALAIVVGQVVEENSPIGLHTTDRWQVTANFPT